MQQATTSFQDWWRRGVWRGVASRGEMAPCVVDIIDSHDYVNDIVCVLPIHRSFKRGVQSTTVQVLHMMCGSLSSLK